MKENKSKADPLDKIKLSGLRDSIAWTAARMFTLQRKYLLSIEIPEEEMKAFHTHYRLDDIRGGSPLKRNFLSGAVGVSLSYLVYTLLERSYFFALLIPSIQKEGIRYAQDILYLQEHLKACLDQPLNPRERELIYESSLLLDGRLQEIPLSVEKFFWEWLLVSQETQFQLPPLEETLSLLPIFI